MLYKNEVCMCSLQHPAPSSQGDCRQQLIPKAPSAEQGQGRWSSLGIARYCQKCRFYPPLPEARSPALGTHQKPRCFRHNPPLSMAHMSTSSFSYESALPGLLPPRCVQDGFIFLPFNRSFLIQFLKNEFLDPSNSILRSRRKSH